MFAEAGINPRHVDEAPFDGPVPALGRIAPVIGGLNRSLGHSFDVLVGETSVAYGRRRVIAALNQLAKGSIQARFLDLVFCDGCVDGSFVERELSVVGRRQIVSRYAKSQFSPQTASMLQHTLRDFADVKITKEHKADVQKLPDPTEEQIRAVLRKINKMPPHNNLDCRPAATTRAGEKAVHVVQGISEPNIVCHTSWRTRSASTSSSKNLTGCCSGPTRNWSRLSSSSSERKSLRPWGSLPRVSPTR
jgi:hypothetical protein